MQPRRLVIATNNEGKLREFRELLGGFGFELVTPRDLGLRFDVEETGSTFRANAELKARAAAELTGELSLADDSGLEVDALGGMPGVISARYAGGGTTAAGMDPVEQCRIVLRELEGVPDERRTARFRAVIAIAKPGSGEVRFAEGTFEGRIGHELRGEHGFGYDPIFVVAKRYRASADGRDVTSAELPPDEKNAISHRGQAARKAVEILSEIADERSNAGD